MKLFSPIFMIIAFCAFFTAKAQAAAGFEVVTGIAPYTFLAERIGGNKVQAHTLMGQNQDPHTFEPSPQQVLALASARFFLLSGLEFEHRLARKIKDGFPALTFVDLSKGLIPENCAEENGHVEHQEDECDPHLWLSPALLRVQAERVAEAFAKEDSGNKEFYYDNLHEFQRELDNLTNRIAAQLQPFNGRSFFVFHPAFGNFGTAFGLHQKAVETSGRMPTPKKIARLISAAIEEDVQIIFVQPQFDQASARIVATSIGGTVVALDPLAKDVLGNFSVIANQLERAFK